MSNLQKQVGKLVNAAFTGIWIRSDEPEDALGELYKLAKANEWDLHTWDIERGMDGREGEGDPLALVKTLANNEGDGATTTVQVARNLHRHLDGAEMVIATNRALINGRQSRTFLVVLAPLVKIPQELEKLFVVVEHDLPTQEELEKVLRGVATEQGDLPDNPEDVKRILEAAAGLTRVEAENAFSLSILEHNKVALPTLWELKASTLKKSGLLSLHRGNERFSDLGGLENVKNFCVRSLDRANHPNPAVRPKGILLLGVPGSGKSAIAKALGNEVKRPTLTLDVGALMGSLVGQTEENTRRALSIIDAMAPCVVMLDEVEKSLAGATGGVHDSGVSSRMFGTFLSWLNDHTSDVFVICTSNNISMLPPEFSRAERFDGIFFVDLPGADDREKIWNIYLKQFDLPKQKRPSDEGWTGAEIRACCRLAALLDVSLMEAAQNIVPISLTSGETVESLRNWAGGRCLDANKPGIYCRSAGEVIKDKAGRKINRPSTN